MIVWWTVLHFGETLNEPPNPTHIRYSRDFLLKWSNFQVNNPPLDLIFPDLNCFPDQSRGKRKGEFTGALPRKNRKRGKRGGVLQRLRKQSFSRIPLPSMILSNAQSLRNKTDELQAHVGFQHEFRDACLLAITETWLSESDLDSELVIDGFGAPIRLDRDADVTETAFEFLMDALESWTIGALGCLDFPCAQDSRKQECRDVSWEVAR